MLWNIPLGILGIYNTHFPSGLGQQSSHQENLELKICPETVMLRQPSSWKPNLLHIASFLCLPKSNVSKSNNIRVSDSRIFNLAIEVKRRMDLRWTRAVFLFFPEDTNVLFYRSRHKSEEMHGDSVSSSGNGYSSLLKTFIFSIKMITTSMHLHKESFKYVGVLGWKSGMNYCRVRE